MQPCRWEMPRNRLKMEPKPDEEFVMEVKARMPGKVEEVKVKVGDAVKKGDILFVVEAMKMKTPVPSPEDGTVKELKVEAGSRLSAGEVMAVIE